MFWSRATRSINYIFLSHASAILKWLPLFCSRMYLSDDEETGKTDQCLFYCRSCSIQLKFISCFGSSAFDTFSKFRKNNKIAMRFVITWSIGSAKRTFSHSMDTLSQIDIPHNKCCQDGYLFNSEYQCERNSNGSSYEINNNTVQSADMKFKCPIGQSTVYSFTLENLTHNLCSDLMSNGSEIFASCRKYESTSEGIAKVMMWGTQTYMPANIAHVILCLTIIVIYYFVPELNKNLYNRAVLRHYASLMCLGIMLSTIGYIDLCHCEVNDRILTLLWLGLQFFTLSTVFWLNVICYDMTTVITKFEWHRSAPEDKRRLFLYSIFVWTCSAVPVIFCGTFEFAPGIPNDYFLKANYLAYRGERRMVVNYYFFFLPTVTLIFNNVLFIYTTYKMIRINQSTEIATKNQSKTVKKKYFLFLKLYVLMGAPWFFGCLSAFIWNELIILKFCRVLQPALWIVILLADKKLRTTILEKMRIISKPPTEWFAKV